MCEWSPKSWEWIRFLKETGLSEQRPRDGTLWSRNVSGGNMEGKNSVRKTECASRLTGGKPGESNLWNPIKERV